MTTSTRMAIEESMNSLPRQERNRETRLKKKRDAVREGQAKERMARVMKRRDWKHDAVFLYSHLSTEEDNAATDVIFIRSNDGIQKEEEPSSENDEWIVIDSEPERESSNRPASVWWRIL